MEDPSTQLELTRPLWLIALVVLPALVYYWRRSLVQFAPWQRSVSLALRVLLVLLLVTALCGIKITSPARQKFVVLAVDVSESIGKDASQVAQTFVQSATAKAGEHQTAVLGFAAQPGPVVADGDDLAVENRSSSDLGSAVAAAQAAIPADCVPQVVLLSDGNQTTGDALAAARSAGAPVSTIPLPGLPPQEVYVAAVRSPGQVRQGVPFSLEVVVYSTHDDQATLELLEADQPVDRQTVDLKPGENHFRFRRTIGGKPDALFTARVADCKDTIAENNEAAAVVFVDPKPRVLLVDSRAELAGVLGAALTDEHIEVERRGPEQMPDSLEDLLRYELVILSNVPAAALSQQEMALLGQYVRDHGGGLIAVGGDRAFTPGGYRNTTLEEVLPVICEPRKDKPKPALAMVLVLDSSVSMQGQSIELAKQAARRAVENLGPRDQVGIISFEDQSRWITPITPLADKATVLGQIDTITAGGRTNMYPPIEKAYLALNEAFADLKHIIVLTDGLSDPDDFKSLAEEIAASGITVSTVAVGSEAAPELLQDIARIGNGNFYACQDATEVPQIFALETISAGRVGITEVPFTPSVVRSDPMLAGLDFDARLNLLGYAETQPKPGSRLLLSSIDGDPLLAWWRYGQGITVAFTSDVYEDRWASAWWRWPDFGRFWAQLVRHAMRKDTARNFTVQIERSGGLGRVLLDAVDPQGRFINGAKAKLELRNPDGNAAEITMPQIAPGRYAAEFPAAEPGVYYLTTSLSDGSRLLHSARRGQVVGYPEELRLQPTDTALLRAVAETTGGQYDPQPADLFAPSETAVPRTTFLWRYLLAAAVLLFVVDLAVKRIDFAAGR